MRRIPLGLLTLLGVAGLASEARAQVPFTSVNDPFVAYYSYYLPRQQAQALQPGPEAAIAAASANRQSYAATNRNEAFDIGSPGLGLDSDGFNSVNGIRRRGGTSSASRIGGNLNGLGPVGYYNNASQYYPKLRPNIHKNNNMSMVKGRGFSGGSYGGAGLPGVR